jgi:signal transduction histidine kinase
MSQPEKIKSNLFSFRNLSIGKQLPVLICILILSIVVLFGSIAYFGIRTTVIHGGEVRLSNLTKELASIFQQSTVNLIQTTQNSGNQAQVLHYLDSPAALLRNLAMEDLDRVRQDTLTKLVELQDCSGQTLLESGSTKIQTMARFNAASELAGSHAPAGQVGKIYLLGDSMYFPVTARIVRDKRYLGYIVRWRLLLATPQAIHQLSQLMGTQATLYFGNTDGGFWTDMIRPVPRQYLDSTRLNKILSYNDPPLGPVMASAVPIIGTKWLMLVELSRSNILEPANRFLYWILGIGAVLLASGMLIAWLISRNITRPLQELISATSLVAGGDYSPKLSLSRKDELGKLARSFNSMAMQVQQAQSGLEKKVQERTAELERVNRDLESFSYSVSHDLRAPLRAISGYTTMLKEDYEKSLDAEASRLMANILSHVRVMGQLIDDLIEFSRMGKRESITTFIGMKALAESCIQELLPGEEARKYQVQVQALPDAEGDEAMIRQVWLNLIGNAIKYSSKTDRPSIEIGWSNRESGQTYYVRDNGVGFDMRYAGKLFQVFQRLHKQEEFEGSGVGLALAKLILQKHQGSIWAESEPGRGATFYFSLH